MLLNSFFYIIEFAERLLEKKSATFIYNLVLFQVKSFINEVYLIAFAFPLLRVWVIMHDLSAISRNHLVHFKGKDILFKIEDFLVFDLKAAILFI